MHKSILVTDYNETVFFDVDTLPCELHLSRKLGEQASKKPPFLYEHSGSVIIFKMFFRLVIHANNIHNCFVTLIVILHSVTYLLLFSPNLCILELTQPLVCG